LKVLIANDSEDTGAIRKLLRFGLMLTLILNSILLLFLPFIEPVLGFFSNDLVLIQFGQEAVLFLILPYLLLSFNLVINSVFYGLGKTKYLALKTLWTNGLVYLTAYILYLSGFWEPGFTEILLFFGAGILVGTFFTVYYARVVLKRE
jgi:Na+-driven multidrug efflux pump